MSSSRCGGADPEPGGLAEQEGGESDRGRGDAVGDEMLLGQPHPVEPGGLRRLGVGHRVAQRRRMVGTGELRGEQEQVRPQTRACGPVA
jgi:hypothetical protein